MKKVILIVLLSFVALSCSKDASEPKEEEITRLIASNFGHFQYFLQEIVIPTCFFSFIFNTFLPLSSF